MSAAPAQLGVGDRCEVTVSYRWPAAWKMTQDANPSPAFAQEYVIAMPPPKDASTGDEQRRTYLLTVCPTRSGAWELPRPAFTVVSPAGEVSAQANSVIIQVGAQADIPTMPQARPLMRLPPAENAVADRRWWWIGGGGLALALATLAVFARKRVRQPPPTPREVFARDLQLAMHASDGKEAGALLSLALRRYAGSVWRFDGPGSTTREIASAVRGRASDDEFRDLVRMLESLDSLRWAAGALGVDAVQPLLDLSERWTTGVQQRIEAEETVRLERKRMAKRGGNTAINTAMLSRASGSGGPALTPAKGHAVVPSESAKP